MAAITARGNHELARVTATAGGITRIYVLRSDGAILGRFAGRGNRFTVCARVKKNVVPTVTHLIGYARSRGYTVVS